MKSARSKGDEGAPEPGHFACAVALGANLAAPYCGLWVRMVVEVREPESGVWGRLTVELRLGDLDNL